MRGELSRKNCWYINKHRYYELKHFCLQYPNWKKLYSSGVSVVSPRVDTERVNGGTRKNLVEKDAIDKTILRAQIDMVDKAAHMADEQLCDYILKGVTEAMSFTYLHSYLGMPCSKVTYYDRYHKFFYILDSLRDNSKLFYGN